MIVSSHLADQLHVTVLNTVVDHLDVVTGTLVTNPLAAGLAVGLCGDGLEDILVIVSFVLFISSRIPTLMYGQASSLPPGMMEGP